MQNSFSNLTYFHTDVYRQSASIIMKAKIYFSTDNVSATHSLKSIPATHVHHNVNPLNPSLVAAGVMRRNDLPWRKDIAHFGTGIQQRWRYTRSCCTKRDGWSGWCLMLDIHQSGETALKSVWKLNNVWSRITEKRRWVGIKFSLIVRPAAERVVAGGNLKWHRIYSVIIALPIYQERYFYMANLLLS